MSECDSSTAVTSSVQKLFKEGKVSMESSSVLPAEIVRQLPKACLQELKKEAETLGETAASEMELAEMLDSWKSKLAPLDVVFQAACSSLTGIESAKKQKERAATQHQKRMLAQAKAAQKKQATPSKVASGSGAPDFTSNYKIFMHARDLPAVPEMNAVSVAAEVEDFDCPFVVRSLGVGSGPVMWEAPSKSQVAPSCHHGVVSFFLGLGPGNSRFMAVLALTPLVFQKAEKQNTLPKGT